MVRARSGRWTSLWVLLVYLGLSVLLTWPLAAQFGTHVPGDGIDDPSLAWNLWWAKHSLIDQPQNPFDSRWQFWPIGINLAFYTLTLLNGLLSIPLQVSFDLVPSYNMLLLASFTLSGYGAYLLCREFVGADDGRRRTNDERRQTMDDRRPWPGPFIGGALYAFASAKLFYASLGQANIASSQWIPFAALYIVRLARPGGRLRDAGMAVLFLVLQAYAEQTYASFLVIFAVLVFLWGLFRQGGLRWSTFAPLLGRFVLLAALFSVGLLPFLANMLPDLMAEGDFFTSGGGFADVFSADLAGYLLPTQLHPVFGQAIRDFSGGAAGLHFPVDKGQHIYVGYLAAALALLGLWHGRRRPGAWFWAVASLLFFTLTLGPSLRVGGRDLGVPLPFTLLEQLPFFKGNRYPSRYSVMLLLSLAPLVALGVNRLLAWGATPKAERKSERAKERISDADDGRQTTERKNEAARLHREWWPRHCLQLAVLLTRVVAAARPVTLQA